ncbi:calcium-binding and coiled-coil domain-containing protein 2 isoform X1 [Prionailurus viverrinus]|uniref:calcium-binding and coiled-coil domain-containing protein 2 isoform X1 n=1 Tax=Prionailurus viverrinus TaxID=61388 RepID=UPI001FF66058|nr:calcium-binding and coiled-coil domain-containing protein 2 isoform X1 [Prionailurus viverrinus]XP_047701830.1 calcium-binding and coiled-coil domain-containing protein 2 isoform X1 [Prionailurus viverrinus]XP_047701831.1 calcium-binding and coiled-coil domain-containing protein 2 isoform X1 [Prionailurus viverrinus]
MEETVEDPPTSAVLLDHCHFSQVIFNSVEKFYVPGGDVTCYYTLTQQFIPRRKDWIGIFRVGWKTTREYYTFMWVSLPVDLNSDSAKQQEVQFKAYYLPKDDEYYQFCYVDQDGVVRGASIPFQFRPGNEEDILVVTTQGEVEELEQRNKELRKENQELKDTCVSLQKQNSDTQAELHKTQEELETLKSTAQKLEQEAKAQKDGWETELLQLKEQNQKMSSENEKMGVRVEQLQAQLSTREKEMEKLVQGDQDKQEQLERLNKENSQLLLTLTQQKERQKKLEQTVEEMLKQEETTTLKKQQALKEPRNKTTAVEEQLVQEVERLQAKVEAGKACFLEKYRECQRLHKQIRQLRAAALEVKQDQKSQQEPMGMGSQEPADENAGLSRKLSENKIIYDALQKEKERLERENDLLKRENSRLLSYMGLDFDSLPYQVPTSDQGGAGQNPALVYGNPYSGIQESSAPSLLAVKKCPTCKSDFAGDILDFTSEQQRPQPLCLSCPICDKTFPAKEKQIFEDHVFCHSL